MPFRCQKCGKDTDFLLNDSYVQRYTNFKHLCTECLNTIMRGKPSDGKGKEVNPQ